jgi:hypothetical protein
MLNIIRCNEAGEHEIDICKALDLVGSQQYNKFWKTQTNQGMWASKLNNTRWTSKSLEITTES